MLGKALTTAAAGAAGGAAGAYIEDVFSTWLYDGNGGTQTITNDIDLNGEGGMIWIKRRDSTASHSLQDTARGTGKSLASDTDAKEASTGTRITSFNSDGFTLGTSGFTNNSSANYASWTFRKAEKFFDVVTFTVGATPSTNMRISHNLGSIPGCIMVKRLNSAQSWYVYHRHLGRNAFAYLDWDFAFNTSQAWWGSSDPTASDFGFNADQFSAANGDYVAYVFAHDAGGFGDNGTENVITCGGGTATGTGAMPTVNLGWEPQWVLVRGNSRSWFMSDTMRGLDHGSDITLYADTDSAEISSDYIVPTATGFTGAGNFLAANQDFIYIAIRRGPMKTPTDATEVFKPETNVLSAYSTAGFPVDHVWGRKYSVIRDWRNFSRLIGTKFLVTNSTNSEGTTGAGALLWDSNTGFYTETEGTPNVWYQFRRAPGFFDVVTYTGTGVNRTISHNLGVAPELLIVKGRNSANQWITGSDGLTDWTKYIQLSQNAGESTFTAAFNSTAPTATVFSIGNASTINGSGNTYIAYLFATCPGVSKVGSYTGTGTTLSIDCGFTAGARFVLIKRSDTYPATGDWYVWDTARGIVSGNDPYLLINSDAAEVTSTDYIDPLSSGFQISSSAPAAINASGGSFIFLAIA